MKITAAVFQSERSISEFFLQWRNGLRHDSEGKNDIGDGRGNELTGYATNDDIIYGIKKINRIGQDVWLDERVPCERDKKLRLSGEELC